MSLTQHSLFIKILALDCWKKYMNYAFAMNYPKEGFIMIDK